MPDPDRLIEIESQLAHLARHIEVIDEVVIEQGLELKKLNRMLQRLDSRLAGIESQIESDHKPMGNEPEASPWKDPEM